jgi:hypothetical protein
VAGKPVIEPSSLCGTNQGKLTVTAYNDDGSIDAVTLNLSANYPAFAHHSSTTATIQSGTTINADRGGVVTATNPQTSASSNIIYECLKVKTPVGTPSQLFTLQSDLVCSGDCTALSGNVAIWVRPEEGVSGVDSVTISGAPSDTLSRTYDVRGVGIAELQRLTNGVDQVTIGRRPTKEVEFLGSALAIERVDGTEGGPIKENAQIAFVLPPDTLSNADYAIVRREKSGNSFLWTSIPAAPYLSDKRVVRGQADRTGVYALVSLSAPVATEVSKVP